MMPSEWRRGSDFRRPTVGHSCRGPANANANVDSGAGSGVAVVRLRAVTVT
jgi:hypothetical protein